MSDSQLQAWNKRQPETLNYLKPNSFRFGIKSIPKVTYFCNSVNLPELTLGVATASNPFVDVPVPGEKLNFGSLTIKFLLQEDMANYTELYNWMIGLGFPENRGQHDRLRRGASQRPPEVNNKDTRGEYSDASLLILDSNNEAVATFNFIDCFPVALSGLPFDATSTNIEYFQCSATFRFTRFEIERENKLT